MKEQPDGSDMSLEDEDLAHEIRVLSLKPDTRPFFLEKGTEGEQTTSVHDQELRDQLRVFASCSEPQSSCAETSSKRCRDLSGGGCTETDEEQALSVNVTRSDQLLEQKDSDCKKRKCVWRCPGCGQEECSHKPSAQKSACPGCGQQRCSHLVPRAKISHESSESHGLLCGGGIINRDIVEPSGSNMQSSNVQYNGRVCRVVKSVSELCYSPSPRTSYVFRVAGVGKQTDVCVSYVFAVSTCEESGSVLESRDLSWYTRDTSSLKHDPYESHMCHVSKQSQDSQCSHPRCTCNVLGWLVMANKQEFVCATFWLRVPAGKATLCLGVVIC